MASTDDHGHHTTIIKSDQPVDARIGDADGAKRPQRANAVPAEDPPRSQGVDRELRRGV